MSIFKAYDIRGVYNQDFSRADVYNIGYHLPTLLRADRVLVGRDTRLSSPEVFEALCSGIIDSGTDVYDMGQATTPMVYYTTAKYGFPASVQITASHNSKEYNGMKISRAGALPVGYESGLAELESMLGASTLYSPEHPAFQAEGQPRGKVKPFDIRDEYISYMRQFLPSTLPAIGVDCSNGMASLIIRDILGEGPHYIYDTLDGRFPNHEPNPLIEENVADIKRLVVEHSLDIGIIFDGDADRVMFIDENGRFISPDLVIGVIGHYFLQQETGYVLHDIRTSRAVSEYIRELGGTPYMWKVGHAYAKVKLRELNGIYGGELAGHYYFRDFFYCDSGILASLIVLNVLETVKAQGLTLSQLIDRIARYAFSGEINFTIEEKQQAMELLKQTITAKEQPSSIFEFDGIRIEFPRWWFNVRPSNTEPYLRLVVEAETEEMLNEKLTLLKETLAPCIRS